ncbi:MAG: BamA/TamA family outer membrane protein [candidate division Zixibacteria bacterium]|nr:BamA/TamA family outer membrane protein [candidate division Zixibacteria bacterium]
MERNNHQRATSALPAVRERIAREIAHAGGHRFRITGECFIYTALILLILVASANAQTSRTLGILTADREFVDWRGTGGDTLRGRHDSSEELTKTLHAFKTVWAPDGLHTSGRIIPTTSLTVKVTAVTTTRAEVVFAEADSTAMPEDLLWSSGQMATVAAGDVWLGSVVVFDAGATVLGEVTGDVIAIGGDLSIGEAATVRGDVILIGGTLRQSGDAKIYGRVFSPGGHRRPRLTLTRAWEFEDGRFKWAPTVSYDRVDGLRPGARLGFQRSQFTPRLEIWSGYGFASKRWQFRVELRQRLLKSADLEAAGSIFRLTSTEDDSVVSGTENTIFAVLTGTDYRDYFGADGGELAVTYKYRERSVLTVRYRNIDYRRMKAHGELWHLFRADHDFRPNFSTLPVDADSLEPHGRASSAIIELGMVPRERSGTLVGLNGQALLILEVAGGLLGGRYDYQRFIADVSGWWDSGRWHHVRLRALYGIARHELPPNKLFYLGGLGTLPGYSQKSLPGEEVFLGQVEYQFNYWKSNLGDAAFILFTDFGRAASTDRFWHLSGVKADIGIGMQFAGAVRLDVAKGLDDTKRDMRVSLRLASLL